MKIVVLQFVRALAALLVLVDHALSIYIKDGHLPTEWLDIAWYMGAFGVTIFFVVSGYVIALTKTDVAHPAKAAAAFWRRRIIRVAPLYWVVTIIYFGRAYFTESGSSIWNLMRSLLFIPYRNEDGLMRPIVGVGWSLNFEMFFYLLFGLTIMSSGRNARVSAMVAAACVGVFGAMNSSGLDKHDFGPLIDPLVMLFSVGTLIHILTMQPLLRPVPRSVSYLIIVLLALTSITASTLYTGPMLTSTQYVMSALVVWIAVRSDKCASDKLDHLFERLGDASYATYLGHILLIKPVYGFFSHLLGTNNALSCLAGVTLTCSALYLAGYILHRYVEQPLGKVVGRLVPEVRV